MIRKKNHIFKKPFTLSKKIKSLSIFLFLLIVFVSIYTLTRVPLLSIKEIEITNPNLSCTTRSELENNLNLRGVNFFMIDKTKITDKIKKRFLCIKDIQIDRTFPNSVKIEITEREAKLILKTYTPAQELSLELNDATPSSTSARVFKDDFSINQASIGASLVVDYDGFIFAKDLENASPPQIYYASKSLDIGMEVDREFVPQVLFVLNKLTELNIPFDFLKVDKHKFYIGSEQKVILSLRKDLKVELASLQLILEESKMNSKLIDLVDLRFDKPIVIFSSNKK